MTLYAHESFICFNHGLRDERISWTGQDEVFNSEQDAKESAAALSAEFGVPLTVYPYTEEPY